MKKLIKTLKKKLRNFNPKLKEECGVFGISDNKDASALTALGLLILMQVVLVLLTTVILQTQFH